MATVYDPIAKDESLNTTEATPRNIADVLAEELSGIASALTPTQLNSLADVTISSPSDGQTLKYDAVSQKWVNANDAGGHTIETPSGTDMTQRANLQFTGDGVSVTDDAANGKTIVDISPVYPVASQSENGLMSAADKTKLDNIIESGTGYIKYVDGTMICWGSVNGNCHTWSAWGSLYQSNTVPLGQFPVPFTSTPIVTISGYNSATGGWVTPVNSVTATDVGIFSVVRPNDPGAQPFQVSYIAIGKWK